jgi:hypothetical protein
MNSSGICKFLSKSSIAFYLHTPLFRNVGVSWYTAVSPSVPLILSSQLLLGDFDETQLVQRKIALCRCAYYGGPSPIIIKAPSFTGNKIEITIFQAPAHLL